MATDGDGVRVVHHRELDRWFERALAPWGPLIAAERQFKALTEESDDVHGSASYDHLYDIADLAIRWLERYPCPQMAIDRRFRAQMMAYRAVADTVRSAIVAEEGDEMVAQLSDLRDLIDEHGAAIDQMAPNTAPVPLEHAQFDGGSIVPFRRRVPRQPAGWNGICQVEGVPVVQGQPCRVIDISMLGFGITLGLPAPAHLVGHRIAVEVPTVDNSLCFRLEGTTAYVKQADWGFVRVGVEFDQPALTGEPGHAAASVVVHAP